MEINKISNLEPGLNTTVATITTPTYSSGVAGLNSVRFYCAFIKRFMKQTANIGGNLRWQYRGIVNNDARNDYQAVSLRGDSGIVWTARNDDTCRLTNRILIVFAAMLPTRVIVALESNLHRITHQMRGKLTSEMSMPTAELNLQMTQGNCGETRRCASLKWDGGIVQTYRKIGTNTDYLWREMFNSGLFNTRLWGAISIENVPKRRKPEMVTSC